MSWLKSFGKDAGRANQAVRQAFVERLKNAFNAPIRNDRGQELSQGAITRLANSIDVHSKRPLTVRQLSWLMMKGGLKGAPLEEKPKIVKSILVNKLFGYRIGKAYSNYVQRKASNRNTSTLWEKFVRWKDRNTTKDYAQNHKDSDWGENRPHDDLDNDDFSEVERF